jgi:hypothetical protein
MLPNAYATHQSPRLQECTELMRALPVSASARARRGRCWFMSATL